MVVSGPSGVGKGTLVAALRRRRPGLVLSVSVTTRPPRRGEVDGVDYRFVDDVAFDALRDAGGLLEWAEYAGYRYGTPAAAVAEAIAAGRDVVLELEVEGARQIRERFPAALLVLLVPPSLSALAERLARRGTDDPVAVARRLAVARSELAEADLFDHVVVNADLDAAVDQVDRILRDRA